MRAGGERLNAQWNVPWKEQWNDRARPRDSRGRFPARPLSRTAVGCVFDYHHRLPPLSALKLLWNCSRTALKLLWNALLVH